MLARGADELGATMPDDVAAEIARRAGGDARTALQTLELAWETATAAGEELSVDARRGRRAQAAAAVRPRRRPPLRPRLGVHQVDAGQRSRRRRLLPRGDARGRRGSTLRRASHRDRGERGRRKRRPARAPGRGRGSAGGRPRRPPRGAAQSGAGRDLHRARAEVERVGSGDLAGAGGRPPRGHRRPARDVARRALPRRGLARARRGLRLAARRSRAGVDVDHLPEGLRGRAYYVPSSSGEEAEETAHGDRHR